MRNGFSMTRTNNLEFGKQKTAVKTTFIKFDDLNAERKDADWHKCPGTWASLGLGHVKRNSFPMTITDGLEFLRSKHIDNKFYGVQFPFLCQTFNS